jgi:trimeric autotransporter adhesin
MRRAGRCVDAVVVLCLFSCLAFTGCGGASSSTTPGTPTSSSTATPSISSAAPSSVPAGSATFSLTVNGANFESNSVIEVDGVKETTTYVSSTQLTTSIPASQVASGAQLQIQVLNGSVTSGTSNGNDITVTNPAPVIASLTPSTIDKTFPPTIAVMGTGFVPTSVLQLNGSARQTSFVNSTKISLTLTAADLNTPGTDAIIVVNSAPGGGASKAVNLTVSATPVPPETLSLVSVTPNQFVYGSPDSTIYLNGSGFDASAIASWNGQPLTTSLASPTQLIATVPAIDFTQVGSANITVTSTTVKPSPSAAISVQVTTPSAPQLTSLSPNAAPIGASTLSIQINGTGFAPSSVVQWNGQNVPTNFGSGATLTAAVPGNLQTTLGNASVRVVTPAPGGGTSTALPFTEYLGITSNNAVYNSVDGLLYLSIPSAAGAPLGNSVVSVDPATGAIGQPIFVGSEPNQLAISTDGKTLFVGLDGAGAVRQVDLASHTAGVQFSLGGGSGIYDPPSRALALAVIPGSSTSVAVSANSGITQFGGIQIFDNGVARANSGGTGYTSGVGSLVADPAKAVLYGTTYNAYDTFTYDSTGVTAGISTSLASSAFQLQLDNGRAYLDSGQVLNAGTGSLLGTFYFAPDIQAQGPIVSDSAIGKAFVLSNGQQYPNGIYNEIQAFRESDFTLLNGESIPVNVVVTAGNPSATNPNQLWRWGMNGLVFRTDSGVYSFRTNIVQDLSQTQADVQVTLAASGSKTAGSNLTLTATITNNGPKSATNVSLSGALPADIGIVSVNATQGYCSTSTMLACNIGTLTSGASAKVTVVAKQYAAGPLNLSVQAIANEADSNQANNSASSSLTIANSNYEPVPVLNAIAPNGAQVGATDTTVTVTGANFSPDSTVLWNGTPLPTSFVNTGELTATISASQLSTFGWAPITVSSPAAGAGVSRPLPFTIYNVVYLSANHIIYNPYDRLLYASVNSAATQVEGNSIITIDPLTGSIGKAVTVGSQPTFMGLSDDGQALYAVLSGTNGFALYRPLSQSLAFSVAPSQPPYSITFAPRGISVMPGTETTIAFDTGEDTGIGIYDINLSSKSATLRGNLSTAYSGSGVAFLDAGDVYTFDTDTTGASLDHFLVTASGLSGPTSFWPYQSTLLGFGGFAAPPSFKLNGGLAFANAGGVANPATDPATQIGIYQPIGTSYSLAFFGATPVEPDTSLGQVFFFGLANDGNTTNGPAGFVRYDEFSFLPTAFMPLANLSTSTTQSTAVDLIRFGSDGLAFLTSAGQIYLVRGPFVVPQLLQQNPKPTLASVNITTATHGAGNLRITVTGSNLVRGATVNWNGAPRSTTRTDATHLSVAIPASDLAAAGTASITITNPATAASNATSFTIN